MRIAVTYDQDGTIFQHFGRTEQFKVYDIEDGKVVRSEILDPQGVGHEGLAQVLADAGVQGLICGGMGQGAKNALSAVGIHVFGGNEGSADEAVEKFVAGELEEKVESCHHHDHEGEGEGCCGGGCHKPAYQGKNTGKSVRVHYRGTLDDGSQFDSSYDRGEPLEFVVGAGQMIDGFDRAVADMELGQKISVHLQPEEAYGMPDPRNMMQFPIAQLPGAEGLSVGQQVYLQDPQGNAFPVTVAAMDEQNITLDANHMLAGKALNFEIELVEVKDAE